MADFRRAFVIVRLARCLSKIRWHVRDKRSMVYTRMVLAGCLVQVRHAGEDCPEMRIDLVRGRRKEWLGLGSKMRSIFGKEVGLGRVEI